jgi:Fe-S cluster assembly scaffold protein SufB
MAMKNVKSANYWQVDHEVRNIFGVKGITVLPSPRAWEKFGWTRKWFEKKPKEGYFIWVKKQVDFPLATCITIATPKISQNLNNLLVIEKGIKAKAIVTCNAAENKLCGKHRAKGKLILKDNVSLEYNHFHKWGEKDFVSLDYEFILGKNSQLLYTYQNLFPPENLQLKTTIYSNENSSSKLNFIINGLNSNIKIQDIIFLKEKSAQGIARLRLVGRENSQIEAISKIFALAPSKGHLDCRGLLLDRTAKISLIPEIVCQNKDAQITHEASIGKISEEELTYLRMRGLSEEEAIDLIVSGFLNI